MEKDKEENNAKSPGITENIIYNNSEDKNASERDFEAIDIDWQKQYESYRAFLESIGNIDETGASLAFSEDLKAIIECIAGLSLDDNHKIPDIGRSLTRLSRERMT